MQKENFKIKQTSGTLDSASKQSTQVRKAPPVNNNISQPKLIVNTNNMQKSQNNAQGKGGNQHLLGGEASVVANNKTLAEARRMNLKGEPQSEIFKKTGWYKGLDKKWKTAIDEKDAELFPINANKEKISLKEQLRRKLESVNAMETIASINYSFPELVDKRAKKEEIYNEFGKRYSTEKRFTVNRKGLGDVTIDRGQVHRALSYLDNDGEIMAMLAVPEVIQKGKEIFANNNHKNRGYPTITYAGPVEINGTVGNMAVAIKKTDKHRYKMHRVLMPDGSMFLFNENENSSYNIGTADEISGSPNITTVLNGSVTQNDNGVKRLLGAVIEEGATTEENSAPEYNSTAKSRRRLENYENEAVRKVADAMYELMMLISSMLLEWVKATMGKLCMN